jgi:hypothetical protein
MQTFGKLILAICSKLLLKLMPPKNTQKVTTTTSQTKKVGNEVVRTTVTRTKIVPASKPSTKKSAGKK